MINSIDRGFTTPETDQVKRLLAAVALPTQDLDEAKDIRFVGYGPADKPHAIVGLEIHRPYGLLRSLAVSEDARQRGLGADMVAEIERLASELGLYAIYLLTTTAADFFRRLGYSEKKRISVPMEIRQTSEFASICPDDAIVMWKPLKGDKSPFD